MQPTDVPQLMIFATNLWPRTFVVPTDERELAMAQKAWLAVLGDLDPDVVMAAMTGWEDHWPPTPHELRKATLDLLAEASGEPHAPGPDEAWREFKDVYRSRGPWSHPAVEAAARALGCKEFGNSETKDEDYWRKDFVRFYEAALQRHEYAMTPRPPAVTAVIAGLAKHLHVVKPDELGEGS